MTVAINIDQPYASLIAHGIKEWETRPYPPAGWPGIPEGQRRMPGVAIKPDDEVLIVSNRKRLPGNFYSVSDRVSVTRDVYGDWSLRGVDAHGHNVLLPLGAVVATARVTDVVPIVHTGEERAVRTINVDGDGSLWLVEPQTYPDRLQADDETTAEFVAWCATQDPPFGRPGYETPTVVWEQWCDLTGNVHEVEQRDISDQLPYGDWRPGRWAWRLDDVRKLEEPMREHLCPRCAGWGTYDDCGLCKGEGVVPVRGRQGVWRPAPALVEACRV